jgi:hypothetical protein
MKNTVYDLNQWEDNTIKFAIYNPPGIGAAMVSFPAQKDYFNNWHLVVGTWDDETKVASIFLDGQLMNSQKFATSTSMLGSKGRLSIGAWDQIDRFQGTLDDVQIYARALSANEVSANFSANR